MNPEVVERIFGPCQPDKPWTQHDKCTREYEFVKEGWLETVTYRCSCPCHKEEKKSEPL